MATAGQGRVKDVSPLIFAGQANKLYNSGTAADKLSEIFVPVFIIYININSGCIKKPPFGGSFQSVLSEFSVFFQSVKIVLSQIFVYDYRDAVGEVERTRLCTHGDTHAFFVVFV